MSLSAMKAVFDHSLSRNGARLVMLALADVADDEGVVVYADYSLGDIAAKCNLSERQVTTIVAALEGGELAVERATGRGHTHQYKILLPGLEAAPHRRRKGEKTSPFTKAPPEAAEKGEVSRIKGEVSSEKGEVISGPLRKDQSTIYQTPLPPSLPGAGAACLPDGQAAPPAIDDPASAPASPIDRFRASLREAVGDAVWRAWFEDLHYRTEAPPDAFGAGSVVTFDTASALRRDRLDQQYRQVIADHWRAAKGLPPDWLLRIAIIVDPARAEAARRAREAARAAERDSDGDRAPRRAREGRR